MERSFNTIKQAIASAQLLRYPDFERPFYLAVDASQVAVGYQPTDEQLARGDDLITHDNIVAIHSRALKAAERNYNAKPYKLESLAIVEALQHFRDFLYGRSFHLKTDHRALTYMFNKKTHSTLANWLYIILEYDFVITHVPGNKNVLPDMLSRMYARSKVWGVDSLSHSPGLFEDGFAESNGASTHLVAEQQGSSQRATATLVAATLHAMRGMRRQRMNELTPQQIEHMRLLGKRIPPEEQRIQILQKAHEQGHYGERALIDEVYNRQNMWWPELRKDALKVVNSCTQCQRYNVTKQGYHPQRSPAAMMPGDAWQVDLMELPTSLEGYSHVLCVLDLFTSYLLTRPLKTKSAEEVTKNLFELMCEWGPPRTLTSDDGGELSNNTLKEILKQLNIEFHVSAPKFHGSTGRIERAIRTLRFSLRKLLDGALNVWDVILPLATLYYNITTKTLHNSTPYVLMFTRENNDVHDNNTSENDSHWITINEEFDQQHYDDWLLHQVNVLKCIYPHIRDSIQIKREQQAERVAKKRKIVPAFNIGDKVWIHDHLRERKDDPYKVGPYTVTDIRDTGSYVLSDGVNAPIIRHITALHPYRAPLDREAVKPAQAREPEPEQAYEVESILAHRGTARKRQYLVKWKNYDERTWEPQKNFIDTDIIRRYWSDQAPLRHTKRRKTRANSRPPDKRTAMQRK